jgi:Fic family protein
MHLAIGQLKELPLSNRLLRDAHRVLLQGVRGKQKLPGEFRTSQNWIGSSLKNATFIPPHHEQIASLMSDLEKFMHNDQIHVPHLLKIALLHYQFETIHPFLDGNGRLGRLLIVLYMVEFKLLSKPALYLSDFFERHKGEYYDHLMAVRTTDNFVGWLRFFVLGVKETAERSIETFKAILVLKETIEREKLPHIHSRKQANAQQLMYSLYKTPVVTANNISEAMDIRHNTATALINDFIKMDILKEITGNKSNRVEDTFYA